MKLFSFGAKGVLLAESFNDSEISQREADVELNYRSCDCAHCARALRERSILCIIIGFTFRLKEVRAHAAFFNQ